MVLRRQRDVEEFSVPPRGLIVRGRRGFVAVSKLRRKTVTWLILPVEYACFKD